MALALARKYRPKSFGDLIGQESVSQTLTQALDSDRLSHAYLFSGLRGSGKTSTARIFAKALLCENGPTSQPCEVCPQCQMANESRHIDIIEMDGASNRGIDDIKELIEHTKYKPSTGRFKIFIIDEVHMLTPQAFNALLKTLEEPPSFVKFILATTDPLKLPTTILSRTQHFRFKKIPQRLVKSHLEHILNLENIEYEPQALEILARSGGGSLRDSITLLDQAIVYAKGSVDLYTVTSMLGIIDPIQLDNLLEEILNKNTQAVLEFIHKNSEYEADMIVDELSLYLKECLFTKDPRFTPLILDRFFRILAEAKELLFLGSDGEFVLSLTLFKMMEALSIKEIDDMIETLQSELAIPSLANTKNSKTSSSSKVSTESKVSIKAQPPKQVIEKSDDGELKFKKLIKKLYDRDSELGEIFEKNIQYQRFDGNELHWLSIAKDKERKNLIQYWTIIRTFVQDIFGIGVKIINHNNEDILTNKEENIQEEYKLPDNQHTASTIEAIEMPSSCMNPDIGGSEASKEIDPKELLEEPMVKDAIELFQAKRVRIKRKS